MKPAYAFVFAAAMSAFTGCLSCFDAGPAPIFSLDFESESETLNPKIGPKGALRQKKLTFVEGKDGNALRVEAGGPLLVYELPPSFLQKSGCVEFWAKLEGNKKTYGCADPSFYCIKFANGEENLVQFTSNNGMACCGLYGRMIHHERITHRGWVRSLSYAEALGDDIAGWHHYAFVWNVDGVTGYKTKDGKSSPAVMFVDGKPHCDVNLMSGPADSIPSLLNSAAKASELGFPLTRGRSASPFLIDSFRIWDYDKVPVATKE